ncbi:sugar ABC transporter permease [Mycoplasmopsis alligatoris]|uniref:Xylose transport system permease protein XylH n=1 Tax=Mycoplasmopsis alligatoris A21JP2 TaxID=747682 RepID=D4XWW8_9BACT|nr:ABC transporter permease [Mycoplasmopsis alligatoris]EFF41159.1 amino acid or sugar ABC transport system, permease protein [Mycoplasmopsis alligatoris A21JP2]
MEQKKNFMDKFREGVDGAANSFAQAIKPASDLVKKVFAIPMRNKYFAATVRHIQKFSMYYILLVIIMIFTGFSNGNLLHPDQIILLIQNNSYVILLALPMTLVIISGNIDLSVGNILGFLGFVSVIVYNTTGNSIILTIICTVLAGLLIGMTHGVLIGYLKIPAFIITLGSMLAFNGARLAINNGAALFPQNGFNSTFVQGVIGSFPDMQINGQFWIVAFSIITLFTVVLVALRVYSYTKKAKAKLHVENAFIFLIKTILYSVFGLGLATYVALSRSGLQYFILYVMIAVLLFVFITKFTTYGRSVYAIGGNRKAAELSGIDSRKTNFITFTIMGGMIGFASVVLTAILNTASATAGIGFELLAISSVFVGGASVWGGIGTITGTVIGSFILQIINQGMQIKAVPIQIQEIAKGMILIAAVGYDVFSHRKIT